ncbi:MAG: penicillin-binding protein 2 [Alphaproteobacteria bacterium]|nr:penicillin-binding protein 2 [Alphaproteobacteria bacterium]
MSAPWKYEKDRVFSKRILVLLGFFLLLIAVLISRVFYLQILQGERYKFLADKNRTSIRLTMPSRGNIFDRNGVKLAENKKTFQAILIKDEAQNVDLVIENFSKIIPLEEDEITRIQKDLKKKRAYMPVLIKDGLSFSDIAKLHLNAPDLIGLQIEEELTRFYPFKDQNAHLIGYVSLLNERDLENNPDSPLADLPGYRIGRTGVEHSFESVLKGSPGMRKREVNAYGHLVRVLEEKDAEKGENLNLTIDSRLQKVALEALNGESASAVVMDVNTGAILALVSSPSFDSNIFTMPVSTKVWKSLINNERRPLQNKALTGTYSPGSIFKLVVSLAALEEKATYQQKKIYCNGKHTVGNHDFHCWKRGGHGFVNLEEALMHSCDVYFYQIAEQIGAEKILAMARRFGLGSALDIGIKGEKEGLVPSSAWKKSRFKDEWRTGDTINLSIGQGFITTTPLQLVYLISQIANGGYKVKPHIIQGQELLNPPSLNLNAWHLRLVKSGMNMVVNNEKGTAYRSRFVQKGERMAGKTASTQVRRISKKEREKGVISQDKLPWKYRDHAIFGAYAPLDKPRLAVVVMVEHGGGGASAAAPVASQILKEALRLFPAEKKEEKESNIPLKTEPRQSQHLKNAQPTSLAPQPMPLLLKSEQNTQESLVKKKSENQTPNKLERI